MHHPAVPHHMLLLYCIASGHTILAHFKLGLSRNIVLASLSVVLFSEVTTFHFKNDGWFVFGFSNGAHQVSHI